MQVKRLNPMRRFFAIRGMASAMIAFAALIVIYVVFGLREPNVFSAANVQNLLRSMSKYLIIGIGQSYLLITGNIDLSLGSVVGMSAMISATLMTHGTNPLLAALIVSTFAGMAVTAWVILAMLPKGANHAPEGDA